MCFLKKKLGLYLHQNRERSANESAGCHAVLLLRVSSQDKLMPSSLAFSSCRFFFLTAFQSEQKRLVSFHWVKLGIRSLVIKKNASTSDIAPTWENFNPKNHRVYLYNYNSKVQLHPCPTMSPSEIHLVLDSQPLQCFNVSGLFQGIELYKLQILSWTIKILSLSSQFYVTMPVSQAQIDLALVVCLFVLSLNRRVFPTQKLITTFPKTVY